MTLQTKQPQYEGEKDMKHKKIIAILTAVNMLLSYNTINVFAAETGATTSEMLAVNNPIEAASIYLEASGKTTFAEQMDEVYEKALANGEIKSADRAEIDLLMERATFAKDEAEKEEIRQELAQYGTYIYASTETTQSRSGSGDVTLSAPMVFYESMDKTWTVTCGGNWNNSNWLEQVFIGDVGGDEAFGVGYTNSTQAYRSSVVRASAYIADEDMDEMVTTYNRSDGDGSKGFGFRLQDYIYNTIPIGSEYVGYKWYGSCTYDYNFASYNGIATAYYVHTYSSAEISGVTFGVEGKTAGVELQITSQDKSFPAYSSDTIFGVH